MSNSLRSWSPQGLETLPHSSHPFLVLDLKNLSPTSVLPPNLLPSFSNCGSSVPNLPLVSAAYPHINWIHQAALQMAVANQIQSNLNRTQVEPYLPLNLLKPGLPLHLNGNQHQQQANQLAQQMYLSNAARLENRCVL